MQTLVPFHEALPYGLKADLTIQGSIITIAYQLDHGLMPVLGLADQSQTWNSPSLPRQDGLWQTTCFEAFLKPKGLRSYFEFNFSLRPAWNAYQFHDYRKPQPPQATEEFEFINMNWNAKEKSLVVNVKNKSAYQEFEVSLTSVIEDANHHIRYWAVTQASAEPDFHAPETFTLFRSSI